MHVLGLPGNPVSAFVCAFLFLVPLIRRLSGPQRSFGAHQPAMLGAVIFRRTTNAPIICARRSLPRPDGAAGRRLPFRRRTRSMMAAAAQTRDCLVDSRGIRARRAGREPVRSSIQLGAFRRSLDFVHVKLRGCGTNIEQIVSVHDLFRAAVSRRGHSGGDTD